MAKITKTRVATNGWTVKIWTSIQKHTGKYVVTKDEFVITWNKMLQVGEILQVEK